MQIPDWLLKSPHILSVPILAIEIAEDLYRILNKIFNFSCNTMTFDSQNGSFTVFTLIFGASFIYFAIAASNKLLSVALLLAGVPFVVYGFTLIAYQASIYV